MLEIFHVQNYLQVVYIYNCKSRNYETLTGKYFNAKISQFTVYVGVHYIFSAALPKERYTTLSGIECDTHRATW